jgi:hypothetical protein
MAKQTKAQKMQAASRAFMSAVRNSKSYNNARKSSKVREIQRRSAPTASSKGGGGGSGG